MAAQAEAADAAPYVIFETSLGAFSVELYSQHAPQSCKNFRELARTGYYDSTTFHRGRSRDTWPCVRSYDVALPVADAYVVGACALFDDACDDAQRESVVQGVSCSSREDDTCDAKTARRRRAASMVARSTTLCTGPIHREPGGKKKPPNPDYSRFGDQVSG